VAQLPGNRLEKPIEGKVEVSQITAHPRGVFSTFFCALKRFHIVFFLEWHKIHSIAGMNYLCWRIFVNILEQLFQNKIQRSNVMVTLY